ncbi:hypothetical protein, partial [Agarivorans sp.]|uniref:hypothetical protein n=1 Tax=Agarivorans sp. TaxID=1872412 RepID=UPI003D01F66B
MVDSSIECRYLLVSFFQVCCELTLFGWLCLGLLPNKDHVRGLAGKDTLLNVAHGSVCLELAMPAV